MLTAIPEMIFGIRSERDNDVSGLVDIRADFGGHIIVCSFPFFVIFSGESWL
jgi:hypothetical protein